MYINMAPGGSTAYKYGSGFRLQSQTMSIHMDFASKTGIVINIDSSCCRTMKPDMAIGNSTGPDITMASGGSSGHTDQ